MREISSSKAAEVVQKAVRIVGVKATIVHVRFYYNRLFEHVPFMKVGEGSDIRLDFAAPTLQ